MTTFSFVHAADIHLDSPFAGITASAPHIRETLIQASFQAWRKLVEFCIDERTDFLLLAGDIFDWEDRSVRAQLAFRDGCARLADHGIQVFAVHGNHDPIQGRYAAVELTENVYVFGSNGPETRVVERQGSPMAAVSGISYQTREEKRNLASLFPARDSSPRLFSIGLVHANLGGATGHAPYAPCTMSDLVQASIDYWALGHVHQRRVVSEAPYVVYPGNIQGRSFIEQGERGVYLVHVRAGAVTDVDFRAMDAVRFLVLDISIEPHGSVDSLVQDMANAVYKALDDNGDRPLICRFTLSGRGALFSQLIKPGVVEQILDNVREYFQDKDPFVWLENIRTQCLPLADIMDLMESDGLLARVLRDMAEVEDSPLALSDLAEKVLSPLFGRRLVSGAIGKLAEKDIVDMLDKARNLCIDLLEQEDA
ncbi:MAG: DNA repair exonuclease [Desulfatibacillum sp.]|nr:DNA repair exonuclease [Desulfatibacillum sp.]